METVNKAVETEVAKVAAVVLKDTSNVVISSAANDAQVAQANSASALTALWQERKAWEANTDGCLDKVMSEYEEKSRPTISNVASEEDVTE